MNDVERQVADAELVLADKYGLTTFEISDRLSSKADFSRICEDLRMSAEICAADDEMDSASFYTSIAERIERQVRGRNTLRS